MIDGSRQKRKGRARLVVPGLFVLLLALPLLAAAPAAPPAAQPQGVSLPQAAQPLPKVASGPAPDLDLLFTAQVVGWVEPCG